MELVNLRLLSHPINWLFVGLILAAFVFAWHEFYSAVSRSNPDSSIAPD